MLDFIPSGTYIIDMENEEQNKKSSGQPVDWHKIYDAIATGDYASLEGMLDNINEAEVLRLIIKQLCHKTQEVK